MDETTQQEHSLITWVVALGILLIVVVSASAYVIANPESFYSLFGGKAPEVQPVTAVNGTPVVTHEQPANTKHYTNTFFEFDYPEAFTITDELVNATRTPDGVPIERFGSATITLTATTSDGVYTLHITSEVNTDHQSISDAALMAKNAFSARPDRGANDSFQDITIGDQPAYKDFTGNRIHLGIPSLNLNYSAEMLWGTQGGTRSTANNYLGVIEDSFKPK